MKFQSSVLTIVLFWLFGLNVLQASTAPIVIEANEDITITLFFPSNIIKVVQPAVNFKFEYETNGTMGTLKARKGLPSNLTVITEEGYIYSFLLSYSKEVSNFTFVLSSEESIGTLNVSSKKGANALKVSSVQELREEVVTVEEIISMEVEDSAEGEASFVASYPANTKSNQATGSDKPEGNDLYDVDKQAYFSIFCENNYLQKADFEKNHTTVNRIGLQLNNILSDRDELYFVMEIKNNSWSDFKVKTLRFFVKSLELKSKLQIEERLVHNLLETVPAHSVNNLVYVCKNFKLAAGQKVYVLLEELDGKQRSVMLPLNTEQINRR